MKKIIITVVSFLFSVHYIFSQSACEKGTFVVGSYLFNSTILSHSKGYNYNKDTLVSMNVNNSYLDWEFSLYFRAAYFPKDNLAVGSGFGSGTPGQYTFEPFFRYYLRQKRVCFSFEKGNRKTSRLALFGEGSIRVSYKKSNSEGKSYFSSQKIPITQGKSESFTFHYGISGGIGIAYLLTNSIAIEVLNLNSYSLWETKTKGESTYILTGTVSESSSKSKSNGYSVNVLLGLQVYF